MTKHKTMRQKPNDFVHAHKQHPVFAVVVKQKCGIHQKTHRMRQVGEREGERKKKRAHTTHRENSPNATI